MTTKIDQFLRFATLSRTEQNLLEQYLSPQDESSLVKGVPLNLLEDMKNIVRQATNQKIRVLYRGPRRDAMRCYTRREDARSFAIYSAYIG